MRVYSLPGEQELLLHVAESDLGKMVGVDCTWSSLHLGKDGSIREDALHRA